MSEPTKIRITELDDDLASQLTELVGLDSSSTNQLSFVIGRESNPLTTDLALSFSQDSVNPPTLRWNSQQQVLQVNYSNPEDSTEFVSLSTISSITPQKGIEFAPTSTPSNVTIQADYGSELNKSTEAYHLHNLDSQRVHGGFLQDLTLLNESGTLVGDPFLQGSLILQEGSGITFNYTDPSVTKQAPRLIISSTAGNVSEIRSNTTPEESGLTGSVSLKSGVGIAVTQLTESLEINNTGLASFRAVPGDTIDLEAFLEGSTSGVPEKITRATLFPSNDLKLNVIPTEGSELDPLIWGKLIQLELSPTASVLNNLRVEPEVPPPFDPYNPVLTEPEPDLNGSLTFLENSEVGWTLTHDDGRDPRMLLEVKQLPASKLVGQIAEAQLPSIPATKLYGTVIADKIRNPAEGLRHITYEPQADTLGWNSSATYDSNKIVITEQLMSPPLNGLPAIGHAKISVAQARVAGLIQNKDTILTNIVTGTATTDYRTVTIATFRVKVNLTGEGFAQIATKVPNYYTIVSATGRVNFQHFGTFYIAVTPGVVSGDSNYSLTVYHRLQDYSGDIDYTREVTLFLTYLEN